MQINGLRFLAKLGSTILQTYDFLWWRTQKSGLDLRSHYSNHWRVYGCERQTLGHEKIEITWEQSWCLKEKTTLITI